MTPPGVNFPDPSYVGELYEEDDIVYTWTGDRWIIWGGTEARLVSPKTMSMTTS